MSLHDAVDFGKLRSRQFTLDSCRMTLARQSTGEVVYSGAGSIHQTAEGGLEFVLYDIQHELRHSHVLRWMSVPSGEWLDASHFFHLTATDMHQRTWRADWVDAGASVSAPPPGAIVRGNLSALTTACECDDSDVGFVAYAPLSIEFPTNRGTETVTTTNGKQSKLFERKMWVIDTPIGKCEVT